MEIRAAMTILLYQYSAPDVLQYIDILWYTSMW